MEWVHLLNLLNLRCVHRCVHHWWNLHCWNPCHWWSLGCERYQGVGTGTLAILKYFFSLFKKFEKQYLTFLLPHFTTFIKPLQMMTHVMIPTRAKTSLIPLCVSSSIIVMVLALIRWGLGTMGASVVVVVPATVLGDVGVAAVEGVLGVQSFQ